MSKVLHFPASKTPSQTLRDKIEKAESEASVLSSPYHDQMFLKLLREWPCYGSFERDLRLSDLLEYYYDDELTLSQDCALEYMFHMQDARSAFDIANALYTWDEDDKNFFILSLNVHAELVKTIKKTE